MAFGYPGVRGSESPIAGFVSTGLVGLYKCDEETGAQLNDATGNLPPIILSSGVQLDVSGDGKAVVTDTSGLRAAHHGIDLNGKTIVAGWCGVTPASAVNSTVYNLMNGSTSTPPPVSIQLQGLGTTRFRAYCLVRAKKDGGAVATYTFVPNSETTTSGEGGGVTLPVGEYCESFVAGTFDAGSAPAMTLYYRFSHSGAWSQVKMASAATSADTSYVLDANGGEYMLLGNYTTASPTGPFLGKIQSVFVNVGSVDADDCKQIMDYQSARFVQSVLSSTNGRFWEFRDGTGAYAREFVTETAMEITNTATDPAWETGVSDCYQPILRQGDPGFGKAGIRIGGEDAYVPGASGVMTMPADRGLLSSASGWAFQITARVGTRDPAADQVLAYLKGDGYDGTEITTIANYGGIGFVETTSQTINARMKAASIATATAATSVSLSTAAAHPNNGLLATYTISQEGSYTSGERTISLWRQIVGETEPTEIANTTGDTRDFRFTTANKLLVGNASLDLDAVLGYIAIYHKPLTEAEMAQNHRSAIARMAGQPVYVNSSLSLAGNGTLSKPYSLFWDAQRVFQPNQVCYVRGGGEHGYIYAKASLTSRTPSSTSNITIVGSGSPSIIGDAVATDPKPVQIEVGRWTFRDIDMDAKSTNSEACTVTEGCTYIELENVDLRNALGSIASHAGTGMTTRALYTKIRNCTATDNDEHGVYCRQRYDSAILAAASTDAVVDIDGLTVTGCAYNGLRLSNESAYGRRYVNTKINNLKVTGGVGSQLYIIGASGVVTNCLLLDRTEYIPDGSEVASPRAALSLGADRVYDGEQIVSDYINDGLTLANITISGSADDGILVAGDAGSMTLRNIVIAGCPGAEYTDNSSGTCVIDIGYCVGNGAVDPIPAGNGNIPEGTIDFVGSTYVLEPTSDGYGDGANLTSLSTEAQSDLAGTARPGIAAGAWNMGAY